MFRNDHDEPAVSPIWAVRGMLFLAMIMIALCMFVFKSSPAHDFCLGAALGLLIGYCVFAFQIKRVDLKQAPQPSDAGRYPLT